MFCSKCGKEIVDDSKFCEFCGAPIEACGAQNSQPAPEPVYVEAEPVAPVSSKDKVAAGLLALFLGTLGIHKFYLGYKKSGLIMLLVSLLTFGIGACVMSVIALVEGILYLTKSDEEFQLIYVQNEKEWF